MECDITFEKPVLKDMEEIARLLSSPAFYDENTHQLNFAAFNLRRFTNGEVESYVSLSRLSFIDQKHLNKKGKYVFKKTESHYVGYALFTPRYLANLHDRLRIYPVKAGLNEGVTTYKCMGEDCYETFTERHTTKSGDTVVAFGYYGYDC